MADTKNPNAGGDRMGPQAYALAIICLAAGLAIGYLVRGGAAAPVAQPAAQQAGFRTCRNGWHARGDADTRSAASHGR